MDPEHAEREITTNRDKPLELMDGLIEASTDEKRKHFIPAESPKFRSTFKKLTELRDKNKALPPIGNRIAGVEEMIKTITNKRTGPPADAPRKKKSVEKELKTLLSALKRNRRE